ncbi:class I SAM-dependent methyltransferase [Enterococcus termitis]|uniref:Methyltransferase n=1 Tax=Enterococcus termitis TaxID=332950 RepID=A0A1E5GHN9_9ENTE|nr:class I SAM-dependent methyltransferase [Enterococcus termitis]OEG12222.1 methyltransferase [Enterococcus termitis]OJG98969.1 hypothetical protein RV18_GL002831 [Enterococcus termitis]
MKKESQKEYWKMLEGNTPIGWDFSFMTNRWSIEPLPWDYSSLVRKYLKKTMYLLDMGTGGGELLSTFGHPDDMTAVTEGWLPNFQLLMERLLPLGVTVVFVDETDQLDFPDDSFDLILNSHESYDPKEVSRVLKPGGLFITQQVGDKNGRILSEKLKIADKRHSSSWSLVTAEKELLKENFEVLFKDESFPLQKFYDMEGLIYYIQRIPWEYPEFTVTSQFESLLKLQEELAVNGFITNYQHRFILIGKSLK